MGNEVLSSENSQSSGKIEPKDLTKTPTTFEEQKSITNNANKPIELNFYKDKLQCNSVNNDSFAVVDFEGKAVEDI